MLPFCLPILLSVLSITTYDVRSYGAKGDGIQKDTSAVQAAVDEAEKAGGGIVSLPAGRYLCGTIRLKSHVTIQLEPGATLAESPDQADFDPYEKLDYNSYADEETTYSHYALLAGDGVEDVAIVGKGVIDGNRPRRHGPKPIALKNCRHITIRDITIRNAPNYCVSLLGCDHAVIDGITIQNAYADGIDPDCSRFVRISNCFIDSSDDAICLKASLALGARRSTEHVTVTNCVLSSSANDFKMGTESSGDFKNIAVSNCAMFKRATGRGRAGIAIESVDGSNIDGVVISNITMQDVRCPVFVRLGNRGRGLNPPVPGSLQNVSIANVTATGAGMTCSITGLPGYPVKNVSLSGIRIGFKGGTKESARLDIPENPEKYPECDMFGPLPAYGFYCRHADGLSFRDAHISTRDADATPPVIADELKDLALDGCIAESVASDQPAFWLNRCRGATIRGCRAGGGATLVKITDAGSERITLSGNSRDGPRRLLELGPNVAKTAVTQQ